jgi:hypothetical protein
MARMADAKPLSDSRSGWTGSGSTRSATPPKPPPSASATASRRRSACSGVSVRAEVPRSASRDTRPRGARRMISSAT